MHDSLPEPILEITDGASYEWCTLMLFHHPTQPGYAIVSNSGCSCSYFECPTKEQLAAQPPLTRPQARERVKAFCTEFHYYITAGSAIRYLERFEDAVREVETA